MTNSIAWERTPWWLRAFGFQGWRYWTPHAHVGGDFSYWTYASTPSPSPRAMGLHLTDDQQSAILSVASHMEASPEAVLKRAIGSYCAKYGGDGAIAEPDDTNVVDIRAAVDNSGDSGD